MADNITIPATGSGTAAPKIATDDIGGVHYEKVKVVWGVDGVATLVSAADPLPVVLGAGTANAGDFDIASIPALDWLTDRESVAQESGTIVIARVVYVVKRFFANVAASTTDGNLVTAVASKKIRVIRFRLHAGGTATNVTFNSKPAGAGVAISELFALAANGGRAEGLDAHGHFETVAGEGLTVTTGAGATTGIGGAYIEA